MGESRQEMKTRVRDPQRYHVVFSAIILDSSQNMRGRTIKVMTTSYHQKPVSYGAVESSVATNNGNRTVSASSSSNADFFDIERTKYEESQQRRQLILDKLVVMILFSAVMIAVVAAATLYRWSPVTGQHGMKFTTAALANVNNAARDTVSTFTISSPAFADGGSIPTVYARRRDHSDRSPPLEFSGSPQHTKSLALIVDDPDAPDPAHPKMTWVHWVLYNIPPGTTGLAEAQLPRGAVVAKNDWKKTAYGGPSPPVGRHRYFFKLYALDTVFSDLGPDANKQSLLTAMRGHILDEAVLIGTYEKEKKDGNE